LELIVGVGETPGAGEVGRLGGTCAENHRDGTSPEHILSLFRNQRMFNRGFFPLRPGILLSAEPTAKL
jgi:hypothetical protein